MSTTKLLIGLAGPAQCGKSTAQGILVDEFGLARVNFADPLKDALTTMLDVDFHALEGDEKERALPGLRQSPRELMQTLGTEWGRHLCGSDFWIRIAHHRLALAESHEGDAFGGAVFSDVRFNEEAEWIRGRGGLIVHLSRRDATPVRAHASEAGIYCRTGDAQIANDGTYTDLRHALIDAVFRSTRRAACFV